MRELTFITPKSSVKEEMIQHVHAINKFLTPEYLENLTEKQLIGESHPIYREYFEDKLKKELKAKQEIN
jgi:hypothetical protein